MNLVSVEKIEKNVVRMEVAVDSVEFKPHMEAAYRKIAAKVSIPGFRPGKAPRAMVEKQYSSLIQDEAINSIYPAVYGDAVAKADIEPVDRAEVEVTSASAQDGFVFVATVTVKPEVKLGQYKGLSAVKKTAAADEAEVEETLNKLQERGARLVSIEERAAELGDTANIDFEGFMDGVAFPGGKGEKFDLVLGSGQFIPGFEEQVVGHKIGEDFEVKVSFPAEYQAEELAGKESLFKVTLHALKVKELPLLDDEFAKDVSEFDTLADLKKDIAEKLLERAQKKCDEEFENELVSSVIAGTEMELPEVMIERRIDEMVQDFGYRLQSQGLDLDTYLKYTGDALESFRKTFREQAERHVRIRLALEEIAKVEDFKATSEEIDAEYKRLAGLYNIEVEKIQGYVDIVDVMNDVKVNKAIDLVKESATALEDTAVEEKPKKKPAAKKTTKKSDKETEAADAE